jgi:diguanylate cyclase
VRTVTDALTAAAAAISVNAPEADSREAARLAALHSYQILDTPDEAVFDDLTALAAHVMQVPIALLSLVDADRQWFKSKLGLDVCSTAREVSFCQHALSRTDVLLIPDTLLDERFLDNPLVMGGPGIRFYAGTPLITPDGYVLGTLCTVDTVPRDPSPEQLTQLAALGRQVVGQLTLRRRTIELAGEVDARKKSEGRWRAFFDGSPVGTSLCDAGGYFVAANDALCGILRMRPDQLIGKHATELSINGDDAQYREASETMDAEPGGVSRQEIRFRRGDGEVRWGSLTTMRTAGPAGEAWTLGHLEDINDRKFAQQAIAESAANLAAVAQVVQQIQAGSDARQTIVTATRELASASLVALLEPTKDRAALTVSATTDAKLADKELPIASPSATVEVFRTGRCLFIPQLTGHPLIAAEMQSLTDAKSAYFVPVRSGRTVTAVLTVAWTFEVADLDDQRASIVTLLADQTGVALRQAALIAELESLALTDPLTGLTNRRGWDQQLAVLIASARRTGRALTIALADLDHFKNYNDAHGHPAGDALLVGFARSARAALRTSDQVARWGGEEFGLALPECAGEEAAVVLRRVLAAVPDGQTCSIGYASWDGQESGTALLERADHALYEAKSSGRNRILSA